MKIPTGFKKKGGFLVARPAKSVAVNSKNFTHEEREKRTENEERIKGNSNRIKPLQYLDAAQKKIFRYIVKELESSGILGNLDIYVLSQCSIAIDRIQYIENHINNKKSELENATLMSTKKKYSDEFFRCCNELCLSPQSRAKLANINTQTKEEDPLLKALQADDD